MPGSPGELSPQGAAPVFDSSRFPPFPTSRLRPQAQWGAGWQERGASSHQEGFNGPALKARLAMRAGWSPCCWGLLTGWGAACCGDLHSVGLG